MVVTLAIANRMDETLDCEVMNEYIVVECDDGFWYCKSSQPSHDDLDDVNWYEAKEWMIQRFKRLQGKGLGHVNDQLMDDRIRDLATVSLEEGFNTDLDYFGKKDEVMNEIMPGAFGNEYANVEFDLFGNY